jgi:hypothetical protein
VSRHDDQLASHVQRLGNHELNELLLQLSPSRFAALVDAALVRPVLPAGLSLRFESVPGVDGWAVVACPPRRRLGSITRPAPAPAGQAAPGPIRPGAGGGLRVRGNGRMTRVKRCSRCGKVKPAAQFYRRRRTQLSSYCRSCQLAAVRRARDRRRQDPAAAEQLRAVDRTRKRRYRALGGQDPSGGDAA